ncbi:MAG: hypothetical protein KatS3mg077_2065 [Candidatus Binatia bacterium]|nr:MAG: hypothetical protein KatS3mg077_2065 [Candidatus Binatia bacterium]
MDAAVIAAGRGERLHQAGWTLPKPLVPVAGRPLLGYVLSALVHCGARRVGMVLNNRGRPVEQYCRRYWPHLEFAFVYRDTPSSMESLFALEPLMHSDEFLLATADTIAAPASMERFCRAARQWPNCTVALAVTAFVHDEKPLWVEFDPDGRVSDLGEPAGGSGWVTAGFYYMRRDVFRHVQAARENGLKALREYLALLLASGHELRAVAAGKCVDVDRPDDLAIASRFVTEENLRDA